jgi:hypothetical protein
MTIAQRKSEGTTQSTVDEESFKRDVATLFGFDHDSISIWQNYTFINDEKWIYYHFYHRGDYSLDLLFRQSDTLSVTSDIQFLQSYFNEEQRIRDDDVRHLTIYFYKESFISAIDLNALIDQLYLEVNPGTVFRYLDLLSAAKQVTPMLEKLTQMRATFIQLEAEIQHLKNNPPPVEPEPEIELPLPVEPVPETPLDPELPPSVKPVPGEESQQVEEEPKQLALVYIIICVVGSVIFVVLVSVAAHYLMQKVNSKEKVNQSYGNIYEEGFYS